jgi:hypothetical protein
MAAVQRQIGASGLSCHPLRSLRIFLIDKSGLFMLCTMTR